MPLVDLGSVAGLLVCPRCRSPVLTGSPGFRCSSPGCAFHAAGSFPLVRGQPALVDFERSVLRREDLGRSTAGAGADRLPVPLRRLWKGVNRAAERNTECLLRLLPGPDPLLLVVGGATVGNGTAALYAAPVVRIVAFDLVAGPYTQFVADAHAIPLADGSVDAVVVQAVLEHVLDPAAVVAEIHRVLRDGGLVYAETPFLQQVHAGAYDFTRFTASGHRWLFRRFAELDAGVVAGPGTQLLWSIDHVVRALTRSAPAGRLARGLLLWLRLLDRLVPERHAVDDACACWFLGRKRQDAMPVHEIPRYYRGAQRG